MKINIRWQLLMLFGLALLGLALRLYGLNWDQGNNFHPDERQILFHVMALSWPSSAAQFFNPASSPLNPHFFAYGSFPLYVLATLGNLLSHFSPGVTSIANLTLVGRVVAVIFDCGTILLTGWLGLLLAEDAAGERRNGWALALLGAALVAFTPLQLQLSHFYVTDTLLLFFVMLTLLACVALVHTDVPIRWSVVAGAAFGLALATKFSAAPLVVPLLVALVLRWNKYGLSSALISLLLAACTAWITFLIAMPYAFLDLPNFVQQLSQQGDLARGLLDLPYVRQFAGTVPYVYEVQNMVLWGMGVTLGVTALAGLLWLCWRIWRRDAGLWFVVLSWVLVYGAITGDFYVKFMRYMLPIYPCLTLMAAALLLALARWVRAKTGERGYKYRILRALPYAAILLVLIGTMFQGLALLNVYSQPNTRVQASEWIYSHVRPGSVLTYEQWDDPLPVAVGDKTPDIYTQSTYQDASGQPQMGLDLYGDDTTDKARLLARLLPAINVITMASDRLDKSIPRLPFRYPLTIHYYQLLFSGQLGFHLAARFENHPNLFGITLDDSSADESYSVFDHPTVKIFVRDTPYPYTSAQLFNKLLAGVQLPPPGAGLSGSQRALMLTPQQIADDQQSPPFATQFPANSIANNLPVFFWWLTMLWLGWLTYPLVFAAFGSLSDRGYIFSKTLGILLLAYVAWLLAGLHILAFERFSLWVIIAVLLVCCGICLALQRRTLLAFLRQRWRLLLLIEGIFTLAFLLFVGIRSLDPDLWHIYMGGEKPMELAFLNAVLRSSSMPPYDPWFSGGYINYYYYGYVIIGAMIKLTGIVPTTAFNLAIPSLFALTFSGAITVVYSLSRRFAFALIGGYFVALIGNLDGLVQLKGQIMALLAHVQLPGYDYWQSSRIIPFTINEFPFWSFLFADLHPHVIDLPITVLMLGVAAALILPVREEGSVHPQATRAARVPEGPHSLIPSPPAPTGDGAPSAEKATRVSYPGATRAARVPEGPPPHIPATPAPTGELPRLMSFVERGRMRTVGLYILAAFVFGTIACVNTWDMPVYALVLGAVLMLRTLEGKRQVGRLEQWVSLGLSLVTAGLLCGLGYLLYLPFYSSYQQLYVDGLGLVKQGTSLGNFLTVFGLWTFLTLSFLLAELYRWLTTKSRGGVSTRRSAGYLLLCGVALTFVALLGLKTLLVVMLGLGVFLFVIWSKGSTVSWWIFSSKKQREVLPDASSPVASGISRAVIFDASTRFTYLLLLLGLCIVLGQEIVYVRDFLDGGDYYRMNSVFKFSMAAWVCFAIGGALAVQRMWSLLGGIVRRAWTICLVVLIVACSIFLTEGTASRIADHQRWVDLPGQQPVQSANYLPTLDGFAFAQAWYPSDGRAITWLNAHVSGSPVILEAVAPVSYQWYNRVSVYTGLPDVVGWYDHESEQRYDALSINRVTDVNIIYSTTNAALAVELLRFYHVSYIYVGPLERQMYGQEAWNGLGKFDKMVGSTLGIVYRADGVTIYKML